MSEEADLPRGWIEIEFGDLFSRPGDDIVDGPFGSNLKASEYVAAGIPIARLQNIDRNQFIPKNIQHVTSEKADELARHTFVPGDILITKLGDTLGKACLAPLSIDRGILVADVVRARITHQWVDRSFLCYQINADNVLGQFKDQTKGTTRPRVNLTKIRCLRARLCPQPEQTRIVEKLEELLSALDAGVTELKAAQKKLAQYRQSLLKAAMEGALTAEWRAKHQPTETGAQLLDRILTERRARWEARQLAKFKEQGKTPPKDWQNKYPEPVPPDTTDLPEVPEGWVWASVDQLSFVVRGASPRPAGDPRFFGGEIPWITVGSLTADNSMYLKSVNQFVTETGRDASRFIEAGTLLLTNSGATLGVPKITNIGGCINDGSVALLDIDEPLKVYLYWYLRTQTDVLRATNQGAAQPNLNTDIVKRISVPICALAEMGQVNDLLGSQTDAIEKQRKSIAISFKQSTAQRQNILRAAFAGQLVPQDPNDEPASVLLERIRAERLVRASSPNNHYSAVRTTRKPPKC